MTVSKKGNVSRNAGLDQKGVALLTVMLLLLIMTVLGIASITVTGLENRMSGFLRTGEAAAAAAESCLGVGANIIQQAWMPQNAAAIPAAFLSNAVPPGPVPVSNAVTLHDEIYGMNAAMNDMTNNTDTAATSPNLVINVGGFAVNGDIDRLYVQNTIATGGPSATVMYRINCVATNVATGNVSPSTAIYGCTKLPNATECSKKIT
jgi:Tfp pilus assembly protein PilX